MLEIHPCLCNSPAKLKAITEFALPTSISLMGKEIR